MTDEEKDSQDTSSSESEKETEKQEKQDVKDPAVEAIRERFSDAILDVTFFAGEVTVKIKKESLLEICRFCHDDPRLRFDYLADLCGLDFPEQEERFIVVYQLYSIEKNRRLRLKTSLREGEAVDSVTPVWGTADWHERETYDLFGITFKNHPNMERILMPEDWEGHPLRKDYPLEGPNKELLDDELKQFQEGTLKQHYTETAFHEED